MGCGKPRTLNLMSLGLVFFTGFRIIGFRTCEFRVFAFPVKELGFHRKPECDFFRTPWKPSSCGRSL